MKTPLILVALVTSLPNAFCQVSQTDTTHHLATDSARRQPSIYFGPNFKDAGRLNDAYYHVTVDNPKILHLSNGISILNTLRGQAPNLLISGQAPGASVSPRGGSPLYVIDGLAFNSITSHYNMNAFEYQSISVINSGNAAVKYAGAGLNSAVLLQRKTGAGISRPSFDVMSYTTFASNDAPDLFGNEGQHTDRWMFTNGAAYAQDFGAIDTRVSYSYSRLPSAEDGGVGAHPPFDPVIDTDIHATNVNTGLEVGQRFRARLILDQYATLSDAKSTNAQYVSNFLNTQDAKQTFLQGNLALNFKLNDWLNISSQSVISRVKDELEQFAEQTNPTVESYSREYSHQQRSMVNFFLNGSTGLHKNLLISYSMGYQVDKSDPYREGYSRQIYEGQNVSQAGQTASYGIRTKSGLGEVGLNYKNLLLLNLNYQHNDFGNDEVNDTYTAATAFVFSEAFHWKSNGFSLGRLRFNYGKSDLVNNTTFPFDIAFNYLETGKFATAGTNLEAGVDFGFVNNRFTLSTNWFTNVDDDTYAWVLRPWGPNGSQYYLVNFGEMLTKGWEIVGGAEIINQKNLTWSVKLTWGNYASTLEENPWGTSTDASSNWRGGLLNQLQVKNWFVSMLIESRFDPGYVTSSGDVYFLVDDATQTKLRDLSVGYTMSPSAGVLKNLRISISGRNLWTIDSSTDQDIENTYGIYSTLKNVSLSVAGTF